MTKKINTPVLYIDEIGTVENSGERCIVTLGSVGSNVRLTLSRNVMARLAEQLRRATTEAFTPPSAEIISFPEASISRRA